MGRYEELMEKRGQSGLTRDEANELGRLMAERQGRKNEYGNAANPPADVEVERSGIAESEEELQEVQEGPKGTQLEPDEDETERPARGTKAGTEGAPPA